MRITPLMRKGGAGTRQKAKGKNIGLAFYWMIFWKENALLEQEKGMALQRMAWSNMAVVQVCLGGTSAFGTQG